MSQQMSLERMVADWMVDETAGGLPEHVFDQIVTTTSRRRPLPRWLAVLREPEMRAQSQVAVGMPRRPLILIGVALLLAAAIAIGVGAAILLRPQPSTDVWPGFRGDASRAGLGVTGPEGNPVVRWTFPATGSVSSSIAVAGDLVLAPSDDGLLHALAIEDGRERWSFAGAAPMKGPLAIGDRAWVADGAGVVHAMSLPDGTSLWDSTSKYAMPSDLTVMDDRLYLGTGDGSVVAMDAASGREVWRQSVGTTPVHPPAAANATIVVASDAGDVTALDPASGAVRWTAHASDAGIGTPVIAGDLVFVGAGAESTGSRLAALDLASGTERWHDDLFLAAPAIAGDVAYATGPGGLVSAIDRATGAVRWTGSLDGNLRAPAVAGDSVYVSADRLRQVVAMDAATGGELWRVEIDGASQCCIGVARGLVFVGTSTGTVYAIGGDGAALTAKAIPSAVAAAPTAAPSANPAPSAVAALPPLPTNLLWTADSGAADFIPWGLAQAPDGKLWAAEGLKDSFAIFDPDGTYVENWGSSGNAGGQFDLTRSNGDPYGMVAFAKDGSFFVLDPGNRRVQSFGPNRKFRVAWGDFGHDPGHFTDPVSLAVDVDGNVAVLDDVRGVIETYTQRATSFARSRHSRLRSGRTTGRNQVAIGPNGHYYVSVAIPNEVAELDPSGNLVQIFGAAGTPGAFNEQPNVVTFDSSGRVYVTQGAARGDHPGVQVFDPDGTYLGGFGPLGAGDADLGFPWGLVVTDDGIYTADAGAVRDVGLASLIRKFEPIAFP